MAIVTILHWYQFRQVDGATEELVVAECPRCGHRTSAIGTTRLAVDTCARKLQLECPRSEENEYTPDASQLLGFDDPVDDLRPPGFVHRLFGTR